VVETIVIGAGQAGLALSHHLTAARHDHLLLERGRIGERWRSARWDSLRMLTPNWLNQLPGAPAHADRDGYLSAAEFASHLEAYAASFDAPVEEGVAVEGIARCGDGFCVRTDWGTHVARAVVIATGDAAVPRVPGAAAGAPPEVAQLHSSAYRSPGTLRDGGVLVVGAGPSGQQIALELRRAGRDVVLAVGRHARGVRRYHGRDIWHWLSELGTLDQTIDEVANPAAARRTPNLPLSGARGGEQLDLHVLADAGVVVTGRLTGFDGSRALFGANLAADVRAAEERLRRVLGRIDRHVGGRGEAVPPVGDLPGVASLDLRAAGITTVLWATGYRARELAHRRGVTRVPGLYVLGLRFQHRRSSHLIGGVGHDAEYLAGRILAATARPLLAAA
jgi:putative flavoprotein involved in K+ transport